MDLAGRLSALITAIGGDVKAIDTRLDALELGGGGGGAVVQTTMVTLDERGNGTITDALATTSSVIIVSTGRALKTDQNEPDLDPVIWSVSSVAAGSFDVHGESKTRIRGQFRVNYVRSG